MAVNAFPKVPPPRCLPDEFKAWFDGFTEAFDGKVPSKPQWIRIRERVAEIDGRAITERVFVDRWWPYVHHHYPYWNTTGCSVGGSTGLQNAQSSLLAQNCSHLNVENKSFDAPTAMYALGKADAVALSAT